MTGLVKYEAARHALSEARTVDEVKDVADKAEALRLYARQAKDPELEMWAAEIRVRATRKLGEISADLERIENQYARPSGGTGKREALKAAGVGKSAANRAEQIASIPEEEFESYMAGKKAKSKPPKLADLNQRIRQKKARDSAPDYETCSVDDLKNAGKFGVIYADPPWEFKVFSGEGKARSAENHYPTKGLDAIKAMPVSDLAADACALFLWCVMPELPGALEVIKAWGFEYKTVAFTWVKQNRSGEGIFTGMGYWTRANAEICLLATRGSPVRQAMDVHQIVMAPVGQHSRKPEAVRERIMRLLAGPYLELYGRRPAENWSVWGNEVSREEFRGAA